MMELPKDLKDEVWNYCRVNDIPNIDNFIIKLLKQGFIAEKFGSAPITKKEKIIEVPVEKIIEKEVYVSDNTSVNELTDKLNKSIQNEKDCRAANIMVQSQLTLNSEKYFKEINDLKLELELTKKKLKENIKRDIYGEENNT